MANIATKALMTFFLVMAPDDDAVQLPTLSAGVYAVQLGTLGSTLIRFDCTHT